MKTGEVCNRTVVIVGRETPLGEAAKLMRENHVGSLVVAKNTYGRKPVGIVTDRDMVVEVMAADLDYRTLTVGEIMGDKLVIAKEDDDSLDTLKLMRASGVRRIPVVTDKGDLAGIVTVDDLLEIVAEELEDIVHAIGNEQHKETKRRR
ncbi:MAG: CBS domain-containing protein [Betaproteobacteria bacterium]|nr:CBS domain-containing protein [Betaproteobacteria bacterium]PWB60195.1 MAG: CBS domain-containing protein [Betaproteobacteria bacterium]